jgi:hypothetical protein
VEIDRWLNVRNLSADGALVEAPERVTPGTLVRGRLAVGGLTQTLRAHIRHVREPAADRHEASFLVGLEFAQSLTQVEHLWLDASKAPASRDGERRRAPRAACDGDVEIGWPVWSTIAVRDVSLAGTMFSLAAAIDPGSRAQLRTRLGDQTFAAQIEVRRIEPESGPRKQGYRVAASFVAMSEESRNALAAFLTVSTT